MSVVDARSPLVIDVRELQRRAGSMMEIRRKAPAPAELANPMIGIPVGSDLTLDITAEAVIDGVLVSGDVGADAVGTCSRCLEPVKSSLHVRIQELYRYSDTSEVDDDSPTFDNELIDLEDVVRDAAVLDLPIAPLCREDCRGLCSQCGCNLNDNPDHRHEQFDDRWAALRDFMTDQAGEDRTTGADKRRSEEEAG